MKNVIKIILISLLLISTGLMAQNSGHFSIQYDISFSTGNLNDYISKPSFRGATLQYRYPLSENINAGFDLGWNVFYEKRDLDTYTYNTTSLSGIQYRYENIVPILISLDYNIVSDNKITPYIGFGIGTLYARRAIDMGIWSLVNKQWQFALKPEIGFLYEINTSTMLKFSGKYYAGFKTEDMEGQGYFTVSAGLAWHL